MLKGNITNDALPHGSFCREFEPLKAYCSPDDAAQDSQLSYIFHMLISKESSAMLEAAPVKPLDDYDGVLVSILEAFLYSVYYIDENILCAALYEFDDVFDFVPELFLGVPPDICVVSLKLRVDSYDVFPKSVLDSCGSILYYMLSVLPRAPCDIVSYKLFLLHLQVASFIRHQLTEVLLKSFQETRL